MLAGPWEVSCVTLWLHIRGPAQQPHTGSPRPSGNETDQAHFTILSEHKSRSLGSPQKADGPSLHPKEGRLLQHLLVLVLVPSLQVRLMAMPPRAVPVPRQHSIEPKPLVPYPPPEHPPRAQS